MQNRQDIRRRERWSAIILFLILLVSYTYFFPRWADPNQNSRLDMVVAIVDNGTFRIDSYVANTVDYAKVGDHYYSDKAPGTAFLGVPIYAALKTVMDLPALQGLVQRLENNQAFKDTLRASGTGILEQKVRFAVAQVVLTFVISILPSALLGVLIFLFTGVFTLSIWPRLVVALAYGLLTPAFAYAGAFYGHQLVAFLLFSAFYLVFVSRQSLSAGRLLAAGFLLGLSVFTEYPTFLVVIVLVVYILYLLWVQKRLANISWVVLGGAVFALALSLYNKAVFGGYFKLGYSESSLWLPEHDTGFMSLTYPHWNAIWGITFSVFRGLFILSPWLLLCLPGFLLWWRWREYRAEFWVALASVLAFFLFNASSIMWWGGFSIGPRYFYPAMPFAVLPVVLVFHRWGSRAWMKGLVSLLFTWSLVAPWGLTLANQAFPPDTIPNPYLGYALPAWRAGNIARNLGTMVGLERISSLLPLLGILLLLALAGGWLVRPSRPPHLVEAPGARPSA